MTTSESKGRFFYKTNRFESIRMTNRIESIRIANWNALLLCSIAYYSSRCPLAQFPPKIYTVAREKVEHTEFTRTRSSETSVRFFFALATSASRSCLMLGSQTYGYVKINFHSPWPWNPISESPNFNRVNRSRNCPNISKFRLKKCKIYAPEEHLYFEICFYR